MKVEMRVRIEITIKDAEGPAGIIFPRTSFIYTHTNNSNINALGAQHRPGTNKIHYELTHGPTRIQDNFEYTGFHFFLFQSHLLQLLNYHYQHEDLSKIEYQILLGALDLKPWMNIIENRNGADEKVSKKPKHTLKENYESDIQKFTARLTEMTELEKKGYSFCRTCGAELEKQILETYEALNAARRGLERSERD